MIAFASISNAQTVRVVEALPNDQFIVEINGKEYRAINGDKAVELAKQKVDLEATQRINAEQVIQIRELTLQRDLARAEKALVQQKADSFEADFKRARDDAARNFSLFQSERELRVEASQFIPHSGAKGFWGKVLNALDSPASQAFWKLAVPTYQMVRCR